MDAKPANRKPVNQKPADRKPDKKPGYARPAKAKRVKKVNWLYLPLAVLAPPAVAALAGWIGCRCYPDDHVKMAVCIAVPSVLALIWWSVGPSAIWKHMRKKLVRGLGAQDFTPNQTFYSRRRTVAVDVGQGKVALLFFWNPFEAAVLPASRVARAWTDDGADGISFTRGTGRVSFLFVLDNRKKIRVDTFTSNQRWKMDNPKILEAISKADMMVQSLEAAKEAAGERNGVV